MQIDVGNNDPAGPQYKEDRRQETTATRAVQSTTEMHKLEDLKVLRRSPDLLNNVKIGQG